MADAPLAPAAKRSRPELLLSDEAKTIRAMLGYLGEGFLLLVTTLSVFAVLFIIFFIAKDALPFLRAYEWGAFFAENDWYPTNEADPSYGALAVFFGSFIVALGAVVVAVPLGILSAVCLSDILPFWLRQYTKPVIEILASIPSVAFGFFALVVFAPVLQRHGATMLEVAAWLVCGPLALLGALVLSDMASAWFAKDRRRPLRWAFGALFAALGLAAVSLLAGRLGAIEIPSGVNALNASIILGIMALPTVVSVSEDALQSVGTELRAGSYALGSTRTEMLLKTAIPAASSGIAAAVILGVMRAVGETMVVWMAAGAAAQIPEPWYNLTKPVRTLTATIAGEMGETPRNTTHYHALFALALCLLVFCLVCNLVSEWVMKRNRRKLRGE
jgi:phosphate transport system permease protein